ncbi:hydroxyacid dehydrogenase [bacterium]|nr:hydroxyacid dehydrogenase [bacterium]
MRPKVAILLLERFRNQQLSKAVIDQKDRKRLEQFAQIMNTDMPDADPATVRQIIAGADACLTGWGTPKLTAEILDAAPNLKMIAHTAGSVKPIVSDAVWEHGIKVTSSAAAIAVGVAEHALGLMLSAMKRNYWFNDVIHKGGWLDQDERNKIVEAYGIKVGVIGAGNAGRHFIKLLGNFDLDILLYDPFVSDDTAKQMGVAKYEKLDDMMREADVISIHAPSLPETTNMINSSNLKLLKDGAIIINTARGAIIDESALYDELKTGRITACLDVTEPEPPSEGNPLRTLPNVIFTPHIAGAIANNMARLGNFAVSELERFFSGEALKYEVTQQDLARLA